MKRESDFSFKEEIYTYIGSSRTPILSALSGISFPDPAYEMIRKNSNSYSIEYVYEGEGAIQENDKIYKVKTGDFFILHPNTYHHYYSNPKNPWKKIWFLTDGDNDFFTGLLSIYKIKDITYIPNINSPLELETIFTLLKEESGNVTKDLEILSFNLIQNLANIIHNRPKHETVASRAKYFIDRKIKTQLTVEEIATYVSVSTGYLSRVFKEAYGMSPNQYILYAKINLAKTLLEKTQLSIHRISEELAFFDVSHFSRSFKKLTGNSPSQYKRKDNDTNGM